MTKVDLIKEILHLISEEVLNINNPRASEYEVVEGNGCVRGYKYVVERLEELECS